MNRRHNFEERLNIVRRILQGEPIREICRHLQLDAHDARQWYLRYQSYGENGFTRNSLISLLCVRKILLSFKSIALNIVFLGWHHKFTMLFFFKLWRFNLSDLCRYKVTDYISQFEAKLKAEGVNTNSGEAQTRYRDYGTLARVTASRHQ